MLVDASPQFAAGHQQQLLSALKSDAEAVGIFVVDDCGPNTTGSQTVEPFLVAVGGEEIVWFDSAAEWEPLSRYFPDRVLPSQCPTRIVLDHVTSRWGVLTLVSLVDIPLRWSELRRRVEGVSDKMLAQTLRTLQEDGLVHREVQPTAPPTVEYSLTDRGQELVERLLPLVEWIAANADSIVGDAADPMQ